MTERKVAIIWGCGGQDGSYLSEFLLEKGYTVIGVVRRTSTDNTQRLKHILDNPNFKLVEGDLVDAKSVSQIIAEHQPQEVYNLAAQSHVGTSFKQPTLTHEVNANGTFNVLDAVKEHSPHSRVYQASTSEMFGSNMKERHSLNENQGEIPNSPPEYTTEYYQDETTEFHPNSPYAIAKLAAHNAVRMYREGYGLFACSGILFNHESPRRGEKFVTRKVTMWIAKFKEWNNNGQGLSGDKDMLYNSVANEEGFPKLRLGNLDARRDWGHARDYIRGMWMMLQQETPDDYVLATGKTFSIRDLLDVAFKEIGIEDWTDYVVVDPEFFRPFDVEYLLGDASKAKRELGWEPEIQFEELVKEMVDEDYKKILSYS
jgi:GDPmannose 4,6-dehydratase